MAETGPSGGFEQQVAVMPQHEKDKARLLVRPRPDANELHDAGFVRRMFTPGDLVTLAQHVEKADDFTKAVTGGKMQLIMDQIRMLQAQAREVLSEAKRDVDLNHARCNFKRRPGQIYHLYERQDDGLGRQTYWSMLSPNEWADKMWDSYIGSYRLEYDMSWTEVEKIQERDARRRMDRQLLGLTGDNASQPALQALKME